MEQESGNLLLSGPDAQTEPLAALLIPQCLVQTKKEGWNANSNHSLSLAREVGAWVPFSLQ